MSAATSKTDYFGTFLGSVSKTGSPEPSPQMPDALMQKLLLSTLASHSDPVSVRDLVFGVDAPPSTVMQALNELQEAKLVSMIEINNNELAKMTDLGRRLAF